MTESSTLDKIMNFDSSDGIKTVIKEWDALSANLKALEKSIDISLPAMLWFTKPGTGTTRLLELICDFLEEKGNLISFSGETRFFEFSLDYCKSNLPFTAFTRFIGTIKSVAGFRNKFYGVIRIDISEWIDRFKEDHFIDFTEFICEISKNNLVILSVDGEREDSKDLEAFLSICMRLKTVEFVSPSPEKYLDYLTERLSQYNIFVTNDAKETLSQSVKKLADNHYFDGYKTIKNMAQDIVYAVFSKDSPSKVFNREAAEPFSVESEYVNRTLERPNAIKKIGYN